MLSRKKEVVMGGLIGLGIQLIIGALGCLYNAF